MRERNSASSRAVPTARFASQRALVTGASGGLGEAIAAMAQLRPAWAAALGRRGSKEFAEAMAKAHQDKW